MTDDPAFLRAICANPDDDLPRLIYADWLDEHGDPDRAEFIRLQCALAAGSEELKRWPDPKKREEVLLMKHSEEWMQPLWSLLGLRFPSKVSRGFPSYVELSASSFLEHAPALSERVPLRSLKVAASPGPGGIHAIPPPPPKTTPMGKYTLEITIPVAGFPSSTLLSIMKDSKGVMARPSPVPVGAPFVLIPA
jgi:uncharacterized protein (TIGR02996 family)